MSHSTYDSCNGEYSEKYYEMLVKTLSLAYSILVSFEAHIYYFVLFGNSHIHNVVSTLPNVEKLDVKKNKRYFDVAQCCSYQRSNRQH